MNSKRIICSDINALGFNEACNEIILRAKEKISSYVCFVNVHMLIEAYQDKAFNSVVNRSFLALPDGMPLVNILKKEYKLNQERVAGMDVFPKLLELAEKNKLSIFLYGTTTDLLEKIKSRALLEYPNLLIAGSLAPPFSESIDKSEFLEQIVLSKPHLVFVSLGCPKQEKWMNRHTEQLNAVLLGVGGAFSIYAREIKRAPSWIRKLSLEWLYRFFQEPRRLFKRYLMTNSLFIYLRFKQFVLSKPIEAK